MKQKKGLAAKIQTFWIFMKSDSWSSLIVFFGIAILFIKLILFPSLTFLTGTSLPLVIVESCSMYHQEPGFETVFKSDVYEENNIFLRDTKQWDFQNGLNKGDVIFVVRAHNLNIGDVIIFNGGASHPIIHRLIQETEPYATKGDNYKSNKEQLSSEKRIAEEQLVGRAVFKIPLVGWIKLIFFEPFRTNGERGLCE